jgi:tape measure domain-containing protein
MATAGTILVELKIDDQGNAQIINRVGAAMRDFQLTSERTAKSVKRLEDAHTGLGTRFRNLIVTMGAMRFAAMDINDLFLRLPFAIMKTAGELERTRALLGGLSKELTKTARDAESAANFDFITNMAQKAPFQISALSDAFVKLKAAGLDPAKGSMQALVDSVAKFGGTSETMKRASVAIQQMLGKGVVSMEELRQQLGEAAPTAMRDMADGMGMSMAELAKAVSKGTVGAEDAINKMLVVMGLRNRGAAQEMMQTWVGVQAQLKTRMELAAEEISKAGFGDAMKKVALEISAAMNSIDTKRLADSFGRDLATAVGYISATAKFLIEHASLIKLAAGAWLVYKASSTFLSPMVKGVIDGLTMIRGAWAQQAIAMNSNAFRERSIQAAAIQGAAAVARAEMQASAQKIAAMQTELAARQTVAAQERASGLARIANARLLAMSSLDMGVITRAQQEIAAIKSVDAARAVSNAKYRLETVAALGAAQAAHAASARAVLEHGNRIDALARGVNVTAGAMGGLARAAGVLKTAFFALGGWFTLLNVALVAGTWAWSLWGGQAEKSIERVRRAKAGLANQEDLDDLVKTQKKQTEELGFAQNEYNQRQKRGYATGTAEQQRALQDSVKAMNERGRKLAETGVTISRAKSTVDQTAAQDAAANGARQVNEEIARIRQGSQAKMNAQTQIFDKQIEDAKGNVAKVKAAAEANSKALKDIAIKEGKDSAAAIKAKMSLLAKGPETAASLEEGRILATQLTDVNNQIQMAVNATGANDIRSTTGDGKTKLVTKFESFIESLQTEKARLDATIPALLSTMGKADKVAIAMAEFEVKINSKSLVEKTGRDSSITPEQKKQAEDLTRANAQKDVLVDDIKKVNDRIIAMGPDAKIAADFMKNPLGDTDGAKVNQFKELIAKLNQSPEMLAKWAADMHLSGEAVLAMVQNGADMSAQMDLKTAYSPVFESIKAMEPDYQAALLVMLDPLANVDESRVNRFREVIAKIKGVPEELDAASQALLAQAQEGARKAATIDMASGFKSLVDTNRNAKLALVQDDRERTRLTLESESELAAKREALVISNAKKNMVAIDLIAQYQLAADEAAALRAEKMRLSMRSPLEKMADDWQMSMNKMDDATVNWSNSFVDMIMTATTTGKLEFGSLVKSILANTLKISLEKTLGDPLKDIMGSAGDWLKKTAGLGSNTRDTGSAAAGAGVADAFGEVESASTVLKLAMSDLTNKGVKEATVAAVQEMAGKATQAATAQTFTSTLGMATSALWEFSAALRAGGASSSSSGIFSSLGKLFGSSSSDFGAGGILESAAPNFLLPFADGGIMTSMGSMPLRKYAAGGIANSPQLAMFGEGAQNEAYVPLPDGRSIPVTMNGSNAPSVTVNVINQSGSPVAAQQGQPRFDGKQMILDVVLTAANQPGSFRSGMKGALA